VNADPAPQQQVERPRDRFGRPLSAGSANRLELPDFDALTIEENHRLGVAFFNDAVFFGAHEAWETAWRASRDTPDHEFFKALAQLGAGYTHYQRNNPHGARALLMRAATRLVEYPAHHRDLDVRALLRAIEADLARLGQRERDDGVPPLEPPRL
jgi:predicted metal-dependent hydrolase